MIVQINYTCCSEAYILIKLINLIHILLKQNLNRNWPGGVNNVRLLS